MRRCAIAVVFILALSAPAFAETPYSALLHARIVQLEAQLADAVRRINLLNAQLSEAQQPEIAKEQQAKRAEVEKAAGCPIDWAVTPPVCKAESPHVKP
jgi:uncharacterized coiled-coil protein SlyX